MQTLLLILIAVLLACAIGCWCYLIYLSRRIYRVLDNHSVELSEFRICLAQRIKALEEYSGYCYNNSKKTYQKR